MVIAKTASRNVVFKTDVMSQAVLETQVSFVTPQPTDQGRRLRQGDVFLMMVTLRARTLIYTFSIMKLLILGLTRD